MADITPERIKELRELCQRATPGPWRRVPIAGYTEDEIDTDHPDHQTPPHGKHIACVGLAGGHNDKGKFERDAAFIAAARQAIPDLLDALEEARARAASIEVREITGKETSDVVG